ncbi:MAG: magnesium transporter CorA family protein [Acidimicrobiales bacterium]|jgi:magnesium transporter
MVNVETETNTDFPARSRLYRDGHVVLEDFPVADISDHLEANDGVIWLDLCCPNAQQLSVLETEFGLHKLAIEDALSEGQRTKLDRYRTHLFLSAYSVSLDEVSGQLATNEVAAFITHKALITVRKSVNMDIDAVVARWDESPDLSVNGVGFLLYGLLDSLVDSHFEAVTLLDEEVEKAEDLLFDRDRGQMEGVQRRTYELRKSLVQLRRVTLPMREVVNTLLRQDLGVVSDAMQPYYHDIYDHVLRATEWTESLRDLVTSIVETNLTQQSNRMNMIMKKVTSWAAIIAVPTAITGFFGQNVPYPGFGKESGLWFSLALIGGLAVLLYGIFRYKDWL